MKGGMKRFLVPTIVMILVLGMFASQAMAKKPTKIRFSHVVAVNTPKGWAADEFAKRANEALGDVIDVAVFPNSQLYNDNQAIEALSAGFIEMAAPSTAKYVGSIPQLQIFDEPFLFPTVDATYAVIDGPIGDELEALFEKRGLKLLGFWDNGFKHFSNNIRPLIKPEDFEGVKFRIMSSDILEAQMEQVGAVGLKLPFSEVYNALEQGVVDGQENTASNIYSKKFHEVQKYMTISSHGYLGYAVVTSQAFWKKLPADAAAKLEKIMQDVTKQQRKEAMALNNKQLDLIKEYAAQSGNLKIHDMTADERAVMKKAMEPVHKKFQDVVPIEWIEQVYKMK